MCCICLHPEPASKNSEFVVLSGYSVSNSDLLPEAIWFINVVAMVMVEMGDMCIQSVTPIRTSNL